MILYNMPAAAIWRPTCIHPVAPHQRRQGRPSRLHDRQHQRGRAPAGQHLGPGRRDRPRLGWRHRLLGISKPDLAAPGVDILAAITPDLSLAPGQLTSARSSAARRWPARTWRARRAAASAPPRWTPARSSRPDDDGTTPNRQGGRHHPATPFDVGSGRIDLTMAGNPGLTISDTADNYVPSPATSHQSTTRACTSPCWRARSSCSARSRASTPSPAPGKSQRRGAGGGHHHRPRTVALAKGREKTITIIGDASAVPVGRRGTRCCTSPPAAARRRSPSPSP